MYLRAFIIITTLLFATNMSAASGKVALIYSASSKLINTPTLEFYKSVAGEFSANNGWELVSYKEVDKYLPKSNSRLTPNSIPSISRKEFLKTHPQASGSAKYRKHAKKGQVSKSLQELLDTLAAEGAVVVDCIPQGASRVRGCGIYYYDRSAGRVVASMRKDFKVGVTDATRWSGVMVAGLHSGLVAVKDNKSKIQLEHILDKNTEEKPKRSLAIHLDTRGETTFKRQGMPGVAPAFALGIASTSEGTGAGVEISLSQQKNKTGTGSESKWSGRRAGLFMTSEVEAQETMVWSLDIGLGLSERRFSAYENDIEVGALYQREGYIVARPGLLWDLSKQKLRMGFVGDFTRYIGGNSESSKDLTGHSLPLWSRGLSFRIKYIF